MKYMSIGKLAKQQLNELKTINALIESGKRVIQHEFTIKDIVDIQEKLICGTWYKVKTFTLEEIPEQFSFSRRNGYYKIGDKIKINESELIKFRKYEKEFKNEILSSVMTEKN